MVRKSKEQQQQIQYRNEYLESEVNRFREYESFLPVAQMLQDEVNRMIAANGLKHYV